MFHLKKDTVLSGASCILDSDCASTNLTCNSGACKSKIIYYIKKYIR